ncbi:alpha/beta hydrolase [Myxococcus sp. K15C18031901]|uniref:alpha/beta fold hydrolase n=1 Tax=Myxococcus dinghuensis TaxID=2906761 RepID=UPI0020A6E87E|nr:alpha/beta hydrolase [Myxococcus dinghuensis]MCP3098676.1 alpha/beta hydrolase [Myxococcus dinghuensis]
MVRTCFVEGSEGVRLAVSESGPASGAPSVLFVHGFAQSRHSWEPVLTGPLSERHRLVAVDLRGHGDSDKPEGEAPYVDGARFAGDLEAVIQGLGLVRPVVVAWSYGGIVVGDYLRHRGDAALGGLFFVAASLQSGKPARALFGPGMMSNARGLLSEDPETYAATARVFVESCAARPLEPSRVDAAVRAMLRVPLNVRRALLSRAEDYSAELGRCVRPVATLHGELDQVVLPAMSSEGVLARARAGQGTWLPGVGHLPFVEATARFEAALADFVVSASR